jgi:hypothetical protein
MNWDKAVEHMNLSREQLARACALRVFDFLVTHADLSVPSVADVATGNPPKNPTRKLHLYRCVPTPSVATPGVPTPGVVTPSQTRAAAAAT